MSGTVTAIDNTQGGTGALSSSTFNFSATNVLAYSFTPGADTTWEIEGLRMALQHTTAGTYTINVGLYLSSSSEPTGSALATTAISVSLTTTGAYYLFSEAQLGTVGDYTLVKGVTYALRFTATTGVRWLLPSVTDTPPAPENDFNYDGYRVSGNSGTSWFEPSQKTTLEVLVTPTCFLRGTLVLTERGEVPVEDLVAGDRVAARFGGLQPIRWIGTQSFDGRLAGPDHQPIRFRAGSLGRAVPCRDLFVSPGHAMLVGDVLAHAGALVNDSTITRERIGGTIEYFHLDLGPHDCVLANGAWAESYFEDHNRDTFHNAAEFHDRFPGHVPHRQDTCLPIVVEGDPRLPALHRRLAPRLTEAALTADPDIHLLADGRRVAATALSDGVWEALVPAQTRSLRLRSRTVRPSMMSDSPDSRALGVLVWGIEGEGGLAITPADAALGQGWHDVEQEGESVWRWTNGDAAIPLHLLGARDRLVRLLIHGWHPPRCFATAPSTLQRAA
jgi:hypothetical protein